LGWLWTGPIALNTGRVGWHSRFTSRSALVMGILMDIWLTNQMGPPNPENEIRITFLNAEIGFHTHLVIIRRLSKPPSWRGSKVVYAKEMLFRPATPAALTLGSVAPCRGIHFTPAQHNFGLATHLVKIA